MFPEEFVRPMREELTGIGFQELRTAEEVDAALHQENRTVLVVVNSICGCAAGKVRPAVAKAVLNPARPDVLTTVFAGQDREATEKARSYFTEYPPSSPSIALLQNGKVIFMLQRSDIESRDSLAIAADLISAFDRFCAPASARAAN